MTASPLAEAVILAHDVYAKRKDGDEPLVDVVRRHVADVMRAGGTEDDIARAWLSRVDGARDLDILLERFPEPFVEALLVDLE